MDVFKIEVVRTYQKPLERQVAEAVAIYACQADQVLNPNPTRGGRSAPPYVKQLFSTRNTTRISKRLGDNS